MSELSISGAHKYYGDVHAVRGVDLAIPEGEFAVLVGPSGCGKSTLLHLLGGLMKPSSGSINIGETNITKLKGQKLDKFRGKHIGIIFQKPHFIRSLNVLDNLLVSPFFGGIKPDRDQAKSILNDLGLGDRMNKFPNTLSQGEQQRLSIARVLIKKPESESVSRSRMLNYSSRGLYFESNAVL